MTAPSRRHDSLIPLSREHQYALMLCLRIHRGMIEHDEDANWLQMKAGVAVRFFEGELIAHFQAEEEVLFPAMRELSGATAIIDELLAEHETMRRLIDQLGRGEPGSLASTFKREFADTPRSTHSQRGARAVSDLRAAGLAGDHIPCRARDLQFDRLGVSASKPGSFGGGNIFPGLFCSYAA